MQPSGKCWKRSIASRILNPSRRCSGEITDILDAYAKYAVPAHVNVEIRDFASRYERLRLTRREGSEELLLSTDDLPLAEEISRNRHVIPFLAQRLSPTEFSRWA